MPTLPLITDRVLPVHKVHLILAKFGGQRAVEVMKKFVTEEMIESGNVEEYQFETYVGQDNDSTTSFFKRMINYYIKYEYRDEVIGGIFERFFCDIDEKSIARVFLSISIKFTKCSNKACNLVHIQSHTV